SMTVTLFVHLAPYFVFNVRWASEIYTLSLHDALPIYGHVHPAAQRDAQLERDLLGQPLQPTVVRLGHVREARAQLVQVRPDQRVDRKSTRLNSSHVKISYAVFCLKKKNIRGKVKLLEG